jgi:hypothetical protein
MAGRWRSLSVVSLAYGTVPGCWAAILVPFCLEDVDVGDSGYVGASGLSLDRSKLCGHGQKEVSKVEKKDTEEEQLEGVSTATGGAERNRRTGFCPFNRLYSDL